MKGRCPVCRKTPKVRVVSGGWVLANHDGNTGTRCPASGFPPMHDTVR